MRALTKKLLRDTWNLRAQMLAIIAVVAAGVSVFYATMGAYDSLRNAQAEYYARLRLGDVFARVVRAPLPIAREIESIAGVAEVRARVVVDVAADVPGVSEPSTLRIVSMPRDRALNGVLVRRGTPPERADEIVVNEVFAEACKLDPGSTITTTIHGQRRVLRVVGVGMSPEFVFQMRGTDFVPDNRRFGVVWMEEGALAAANDMTGAFNDVVVSLASGAREADVITDMDRLLAPWGTLGAQNRRDGLLSHRFLSDELDQLRASARFVPVVFLGVAAFLLNVVLGRLVATQRSQIGTLKAFGMSDVTVGLHYLELVLFVVLVGAGIGAGLGAWLGGGMTNLYQGYYRFPELSFRGDPSTLPTAVGIALLASVAGAIGAVRRATALPPAEAMRPEPPPAFRATAFDRPAMRRALSTVSRMILRNLLRRPVRTALSITGVALAASIVVLMAGMYDSLGYLTDVQFNVVQRSDATVLFAEARAPSAAHDLARLPGVMCVEPFRVVPVVLRRDHARYRTALTGLRRDGDLRTIIDQNAGLVPIPESGLLLSRIIADALRARPGDLVEVEILEGARRTRAVPVAAVVDDFMNVSATMDLDALGRLTGGPEVASGVEMRVDPLREKDVLARLRGAPSVTSVTLRSRLLQSFREMIDQNMGVTLGIELTFAFVIAFAVVFNAARTALSERARELATMRVLGFTSAEVAGVLLGELGVITALAIPLGLVLGRWLAGVVLRASSSDLFRLPLVVEASSYAGATLVVAFSAAFSAIIVGAKVGKLDLVGVLKTRD